MSENKLFVIVIVIVIVIVKLWKRSDLASAISCVRLRTSANVCERGAYVKLLLGELIRIRSDLANL